MLKIYNTFHLVTSEDGILMVSLKSTDHPFIIVNNYKLGLLVFHAGEENYNLRYNLKDANLLNMAKMTTYFVDIEDKSHWAVAIPYQGKTIDPNSLYTFSSISVQKQFTDDDFPYRFENYDSLAIITGIPE